MGLRPNNILGNNMTIIYQKAEGVFISIIEYIDPGSNGRILHGSQFQIVDNISRKNLLFKSNFIANDNEDNIDSEISLTRALDNDWFDENPYRIVGYQIAQRTCTELQFKSLCICPYCGNNEVVEHYTFNKSLQRTRYFIECCKCNTESKNANTPEIAIEYWYKNLIK